MSQSISLVVVATGPKYVKYAVELHDSIEQFMVGEYNVVIFTDDPKTFTSAAQSPNIKVIEIAQLRWPDASLLRYHLITDYASEISGDFIIYVDADSVLNRTLSWENFFNKEFPISFVQHPGMYKRGILRNLYKRTVKPAWERNKKSQSYVPWYRRKCYVYGGIWGGEKELILGMCWELRKATELDLENDFYPISYDESHLNKWITNNNNWRLLTPEFAFADDFPWLSNLPEPYIKVLNKPRELVLEKNLLEKNENRQKK